MAKLAGVLRLLKKEPDRVTKELHRIGAALAVFGKDIFEGKRSPKPVQVSSGTDCGCPKSALGKGLRKLRCSESGSSRAGKAKTLGSCTKEDRRRAKSEMGKGEGGKEDSLIYRGSC
jgi:hypothetical protein